MIASYENYPLNRGLRSALVGFCALLAFAPQAARTQEHYDPAMFSSLQWRNLGPMRGGRATAGVGVPGNRRLYYMGTAGGGVWKTEDGGEIWHNISDGFFLTGSIGDIAVYPDDPAVIYVGTGEAPVRQQMTSYGDGVYKSTDAGRTWVHVGLRETRQISKIVIHPRNPNLVYVAAQGSRWAPTDDRGIYRSRDGGATWHRILFSSRTAGASELVMDPRDPLILYAAFWDMQRLPWALRSGGPGSGIWKSTDGGDSWKRLTGRLPAIMGKIRLAISPANSARLYAAIENVKTGLFRSDDAGKSWRLVNADGNLATRPWYFMGVTADPKNAEVVYYSAAALLKSIDGGVTFKLVRTRHDDHHTLWINPSDSENLITTDDGGASVSFDGGRTWSPETNQPTGQFYAAQTDDLFPYNIYGEQQDRDAVSVPNRLLPGTAPERDLGRGESGHFAFDPKHPRLVFATNFLGVVQRRDTKTGQSENVSIWPGQNLGLSAAEMPYRFNWSAPLACSPCEPFNLYHGANVLLKSEDQGNTWTAISPDLTRNDKRHQGRDGLFWHDGSGGDVYNSIFVIAPSPHEAQTIWVGTDDGLLQLTRDQGRTWTSLAPKSWGEGLVYSIEVSPHDPGTAYVAFSRHRFEDRTPHFYKTTDYGRSWTDLARDLPQDSPARVLREDPKRKGLLYSASEYQLWVSFDGGAHWQSFQQNLPHTPISDLTVHDDDLIVATEGRGFWLLDDLTSLHQLTPKVAAQNLFLFKPRSAVRISAPEAGTGDQSAGLPNGAHAPDGALIRYSLGAALSASLRLEILEASGSVVRTFRSVAAAPTGVSADTPVGAPRGANDRQRPPSAGNGTSLPANFGLNQLVWDLRGAPSGEERGPLVPSGRYTVRLTLGATTLSQTLDVVSDPRIADTPEAQQARASLARHLLDQAAAINQLLADVSRVRSQADEFTKQAKTSPLAKRDAAIHSLSAKLQVIQKTLAPFSPDAPPGPGDQTPMSVGTGTAYEMAFLEGEIDRAAGPVTEGQRLRAATLETEWVKARAAATPVLTTDLRDLNALLVKSGLTPIKADAAH